ncbi:MAG: hypothetical protein ACXW3Z_07055 [Limisphaerales bacterium]
MKLAILVFALTAFVLLIIWMPSAGLKVTTSSDAIRNVRHGVQAAEDQIPRVGGGLADVDRDENKGGASDVFFSMGDAPDRIELVPNLFEKTCCTPYERLPAPAQLLISQHFL